MILLSLIGLLMTFYYFGIYTTLPKTTSTNIFGVGLAIMYVMFTYMFCESYRLIFRGKNLRRKK